MPNNFWGDIGSEIFTELNSQQEKQLNSDKERKKELIGLLGGMVDQVDPNSRSTLFEHIFDVAGIPAGSKPGAGGKAGKIGLRDFLRSFSGMPDKTVENQLGDKARQIGQLGMAPGEAKGIREKGDLARLFDQKKSPLESFIGDQFSQAPKVQQAQQQATNRQQAMQNEAGLKNRIVFRDPRQERLDEIEARYTAQTQAALEKLGIEKALGARYKEESDKRAQINRMTTEAFKQQGKAMGDLNRRGWGYFAEDVNSGKITPEQYDLYFKTSTDLPYEYLARAQRDIDEERKINLRLKGSQINRNNNATTGEKALNLKQKMDQDSKLNEEVGKLMTTWQKGREDVETYQKDYNNTLSNLENYTKQIKGLKIDPESFRVINTLDPNGKLSEVQSVLLQIKLGNLGTSVDKEESKLREASRKLGEAKSNVTSSIRDLSIPRYKNFIQIDGGVPSRTDAGLMIDLQPKGPNAATPPTPATRGGDPSKVGIGTQRKGPAPIARVSFDQGRSRGYVVGQEVEMMGHKYKIESLEVPYDASIDPATGNASQFFILKLIK